MNWFRVLPASGRRSTVALVALTLVGGAGLLAQTAGGQTAGAQTPQQTPAPQQTPEPPDPLKFSIDVPVVIVNMVKPDKVADFEASWAAIRAQFEKSTRPEVKEFAGTLSKFYRVDEKLVGPANPAGSPAIFVFQIDTPSKTQSYNPVKIIYYLLHKNGEEGGITRAEADEIYNKLMPTYQQIIPWPLVKVG
jgi:hypothetical protein